jgi:hypothetical protein
MVVVNEKEIVHRTRDHTILEKKVPTKFNINEQIYINELADRVNKSQEMPDTILQTYEDAQKAFVNVCLPPDNTISHDDDIDDEPNEGIVLDGPANNDGQINENNSNESDGQVQVLDQAFIEDGSLPDSHSHSSDDVGIAENPHPPIQHQGNAVNVPDVDVPDANAVPIDDDERADLASELNVLPEFVPDFPASFKRQQKFLRDVVNGTSIENRQHTLPPQYTEMPPSFKTRLKDPFYFDRHHNVSFSVSTIDTGICLFIIVD